MIQLLKIFYFLLLSGKTVLGDDDLERGYDPDLQVSKADDGAKMFNEEGSVEKAIEKCETIALSAEKKYRERVLPVEDAEKQYVEMIDSINEIIELVQDKENAYKFMKAKGFNRIVSPNLRIPYVQLTKRLLLLIQSLFHIAPVTTKATIPINIVDKLLDIFENESNLALKAHALDILYLWLPGSPRIQSRIMKLKGLEPFYAQISKLDTTVIYTLLDLFNKILEEHINVRDENKQRNKHDYEISKMYQKVGLLERMATANVCNGLLNIFEATWSYSASNENIIVPVFELIRNIKPFCLNIYKGRANAIELFDRFLGFIKDPTKKELFNDNDLNLTNIEMIIKEYSEKVKYATEKDEL